MESSMVIKVKYEDTLRRFNARVIDEKLDLNMCVLREKILSLFSFAPETVITVTYLDEDGDEVTLIDDEDLQDVVRQDLNPLRITVKIDSEKSRKSSARSSGNSTPLRSARVHKTLPFEILKSMPDPFGEMLSKLSGDLASKAISSSPELANLVDSLSKMGLSYQSQRSEIQFQNKDSEETSTATASKSLGSSKVGGTASQVFPSVKVEELSLKSNEVPAKSKSDESSSKNDKARLGNTSDGAKPSETKISKEVKRSTSSSKNSKSDDSSSKNDKVKLGSPADGAKTSEAEISVEVKTLMSNSKNSPPADSLNVNDPYESATSVRKARIAAGKEKVKKFRELHGLIRNANKSGSGRKPINTGAWGSPSYIKGSPICSQIENPISGPMDACIGIGNSSLAGVRCDGCGLQPIAGLRFKSKVKDDYDLCQICFEEMGNDTDYIRMGCPATYRRPLSLKGLYNSYPRVNPPSFPQVFGGCLKPERPRLGSSFIQDVNVLDGTIMAPSTPFTKVWRMRNNGSTVWPQGTKLVWLRGDRLSNMLSVELPISGFGVPADHELNVSVDCVAPAIPGRYISYWKMALPSGLKFGECVWALIVVTAHSMDQIPESSGGINLNLPPVGDGMASPEIIYVDPEPLVEGTVAEPYNSNKTTELVEPVKDDVNVKEQQETIFPINDTLLVDSDALSPSPLAPHVLYPPTNFSELVAPSVPFTAPPPASSLELDSGVESNLLKELEEMGFRQVDLNKEILRLNEYDLEKSVDDLCGVSEWDPMLEELQEMGFNDIEMNKKLLIKNNGSIKRVVMDLIAEEKI